MSRLVRAAIVGAAALTSVSAQAASTLYGLTRSDSGRNLVSFSSETPGTFATNVAIHGDVNRSIDLFSMDMNTSNNMLYALGSTGRAQYALFTIGLDGLATKVGAGLGMNIASENAGLDYDVSLNMFRILTNDETSFWVDPVTGIGSAGDSFDYAAGDPLGSANPNVIAAAYQGQLWVLDKNGPGNSGLLSTLSGPTLASVASLNRMLDTNASFDIAANGEAYFHDGQIADRLYLLNLADGTSVDKGALQMQLTGLTGGPGENVAAVPEPASWAMMIAGFGLAGSAMRRRKVRIAFG